MTGIEPASAAWEADVPVSYTHLAGVTLLAVQDGKEICDCQEGMADIENGRVMKREDRKSTRLNSSHSRASRMPSSA